MRRRYICPVVGSGTEEDPYRLQVADYPARGHTAVIPNNPDGSPRFGWGLAVVAGTVAQHDAIAADPDIRRFPNIALDSSVAEMTAAQRLRIQEFLVERGIDTTWIIAQTSFREILRFVGRHLDPNYHEDRETIADVD